MCITRIELYFGYLFLFFYSSGSQPGPRTPWGSNKPFKGSPKNTRKYIYIIVHNTSKLQLWSSNKDNFVVGISTTQGAVLKGLELKVENHCLSYIHKFFGRTFFLSVGLLIGVNYILVKQVTQKENLQTARAGSKGEKRIREGSWGGGWEAAGVTQWKQCFKNWNRMAKEREEKQAKRFLVALSK